MTEQLVKFETARLAKEQGFDWGCQDCFNSHGNTYSNGWCEILDDWFEGQDFFNSKIEKKQTSHKYYTLPTQSLLQKWLREEHDIKIIPPVHYSRFGYSCNIIYNEDTKFFETYEEALEIELQEALRKIK